MPQTFRRSAVLLALALVIVGVSGCATYWRDRSDDFADTFDLGFTTTKEFKFVFYHSFESVIAVGRGDFEATFFGWGNGKFGTQPHYLKAWGALVWADEQVGWGDYDKNDRSTLYTQTVGLVGAPAGMINGNSNPHYVPT